MEIAPEWRPSSFWRLRGSYSYLHMDVYRSAHSEDVEPPSSISGASPQSEVSIQSAFDISKRLQVDLAYRYVGALPALAVAAYSTGDVRVGWRFNRQLELSLVGQNLIQPWHLEYGPPPGVGIVRNAYARLTWSR